VPLDRSSPDAVAQCSIARGAADAVVHRDSPGVRAIRTGLLPREVVASSAIRRPFMAARLGSLFFALVLGCGPGSTSGGDGGGGDSGLDGATLEVTPAAANVVVVDGTPAEQAFTAILHYADGTTEDVTAQTAFAVDEPMLGGFTGAVFTAQGLAGGEGLVTAGHSGVFGNATITVRVEHHRVVDPAPADASTWFDGASENAALAPNVVYPPDGTMVPPNLGDFEVHWLDSAGADLFEVRLWSSYVDLRVYVSGTPNTGTWIPLLLEEWSLVGETERGGMLHLTVRGMTSSAHDSAGTSTAQDVRLGEQNIEGGIYYWASTATGGAPYGIFRHDMSNPGEPAERYLTTAETSDRCVACHVLSRDGTRMAVTYDGGDGAAGMYDVGARTETLVGDGTYHWNFAAFEPDGSRILTVSHGVMTLRDVATGADLGTVPTGGYASHPDFKPSGDAIVYTVFASPGSDWASTGGSIVTQPFDAASGTFGTPTTLVAGAAGVNFYYPAWSPDGAWILYNKSTEDAYDDPDAELWVVRSDGSTAPVRLQTANMSDGLTNSWGRWAPFEQSTGGETPETFFWFTFSSKRAFGVRLAAGQPQIWMAPFFPSRAQDPQDPCYPPFRLPFQDIVGHNHIAQWTETVVPIE